MQTMKDPSFDESFGHSARQLTQEEILKLREQDAKTVSEFKQRKLEQDARKNWDIFYKRNETRFFKDRHWIKRELEELCLIRNDTAQEESKQVLLEVGCGVGNLIFPLIEESTAYFVYACDFSCRAIQFVQGNTLYDETKIKAFQCDVVKDNLADVIPAESVDVVTLMFVLSAIHPDNMGVALENIHKVLKPDGVILFRDYGLYDQAMLRFSPGSKLSENLYVRQDGTRAYYFSTECLSEIFTKSKYEVICNTYIQRKTENPKIGLSVPRIFVQAKFKKS
ncbi:METTL6 (predicted) [Pycnogonum litorale]